MEIPITYIYKLYKDNKFFYVGKTCNPYERLIRYNQMYLELNENIILKMIIIDKYYDREHKWIFSEKDRIENIELPVNNEKEYNIGDDILIRSLRCKKVFDENLNKIWDTIKDCSGYYRESKDTISKWLNGYTKNPRNQKIKNLHF